MATWVLKLATISRASWKLRTTVVPRAGEPGKVVERGDDASAGPVAREARELARLDAAEPQRRDALRAWFAQPQHAVMHPRRAEYPLTKQVGVRAAR